MADQYTQGGVTAGGTPTPMPIHPGEHVIPQRLELRAKGRGIRRIFGYRIATFPAIITYLGKDGECTPAHLMRDLAVALREAADALEADAEG